MSEKNSERHRKTGICEKFNIALCIINLGNIMIGAINNDQKPDYDERTTANRSWL